MSDPRNAVIALLAALAALLLLLLLRTPDREGPAEDPGAGTPARVLDVLLDREGRRHVDLFFDRALGEERVGEVLPPETGRIEPAVGGAWRWRGANVLRFEVSGRFRSATRYEIELDPEQLAPEGYTLVGETSFEFTTDHFQVDRVVAHEEPDPEGRPQVRLRGTVFFNYPVDPSELAPRVELRDVASGAEIAVEMETGGARKALPWRSGPIEKGARERELVLRIAADLTSHDGNVPLGSDFTHPIPIGSGDRLVVRSVDLTPGEDESTIRLELSSAVDATRAERHLSVEPPVEFRARSQRNVLVLSGAFRPGARYRLRLARGLVAQDRAELAEDWTGELRLPDLPASVDFQSSGMFLSASGPRALVLETVNAAKIQLAVERVYRNNLLYLLEQRAGRVFSEDAGYGPVGPIYGDRIAERTLDVEGPRNTTIETVVQLDEYVAEAEPGFYRIVAGQPRQHHWTHRQRWVLVTDLGIVAKRGRDQVLAWVWSFRSLRPAAGARVQLFSEQNQLLAEGVTDTRGAVRLSGLATHFEEHRPALLVVERGRDWSFLPFERSRTDTSGLDVAGAAAPSGYDAYLYGERDLYRPGETLRGVAIVRDEALGTPPDMPAVLRHRDPQGQLRGEWRLELRNGMAEIEREIPAWERTGRHAFELRVGDEVIGRYRFQVEEFVPDRIKVEIEPESPSAGPGRKLRYGVRSAYLFGPPAAGLAVESRVRLEPAPFAPAGFEHFLFENPEREFEAREIAHRQAVLDETGHVQLEFQVPEGLVVPASLEAVLSARVQEPGGRGVSARQRLRVHPYTHYLGLRRSAEGYAEPGQPVELEFVAVSPEGVEAAAGALRAELFRDRWQTVLRRTPSGSWRYESKREPELVATQLVEPGRSRGRLSFTPPDYGSYRVVLSDEDAGASTRVSFYASGWGFAPWAVERPGRVELDLDAAEHRVGETAMLQVRAPFAGTLLVTVERDEVQHWELHRLEGNTAKIPLPVRAAYAPNAYVTATLVRGVEDLEPGTPARAFGAVPLFVERETRRLPLELGSPEEIRPETALRIEARTTPGARLTIAAVDEGVLQLIAQPTPDAFGHFYRKRALGVSSHDIFALLFPDLEGVAPPGGGAAGAGLAQFLGTGGIRRVQPVAFWSGVVEADASGRAQVSFQVPEFQGALRVMAVANDRRRFGSAESQVRVRSPLVLLPTFPRFLSFDERIQIPVSVRNDTGTDGRFRVELRADGPAAIEGEAVRELEVPDGSERRLDFALLSTAEPGRLDLELEARGQGERAGARVELGVRADLPAVTTEEAGQIRDATTRLAPAGLERLRPEGATLELRISPVPLLQLYGKLESLLHYPYGCLEQTVSRAFPLLYVADLARELDPELFEENDPQALVAAGIQRVGSMRLAGGGFTLWPGGRAPDAFASVYATHFLVEAERAGHQVPTPLLEGALDFTAGEARPRAGLSRGALERAVYASYVLARAGRADVAALDFVREKHRPSLRASERALLGAAYASAGDPAPLASLWAGLEDAERIRRQTGGNFASTTRNRALILLAMLDAAPDDARIPALAGHLARDAVESGWWSTQETAMALLALGQLFQRQSERAPYAGEVWAGGARVASFGAGSTQLRELPAGPLEIRMEPGYEAGAAYYSLRLRGVPRDDAFEPSAEGLEIEREIRGRDGDEVLQGDLLELRLRLRSTRGRIENVVVQQLLPAGLEVENARLATAETRPGGDSDLSPQHFDVRDDRLLVFVDLPDGRWRSVRALLRAVSPGRFRLPPVQAEAMYDGSLRATGERDWLEVGVRQ